MIKPVFYGQLGIVLQCIYTIYNNHSLATKSSNHIIMEKPDLVYICAILILKGI